MVTIRQSVQLLRICGTVNFCHEKFLLFSVSFYLLRLKIVMPSSLHVDDEKAVGVRDEWNTTSKSKAKKVRNCVRMEG